uniref:Retrotransposon protein, putative, unclassified n=1 Tax=Oryza sativa subsp. japonica TaxID=39947 RepID=Q2QXA7_ORYSJ|nr:retrotransposon protein, putative, unclassified [Oryza sativa Japonica Group]
MATDLSQSLDLSIYRHKDYLLLTSTADRVDLVLIYLFTIADRFTYDIGSKKYKLKVVAADEVGSSSSQGDKGAAAGSGDKGDVPQDGTVEDLGADDNQEPLQFNNFQDRIDYAVQHALINQSGVLAFGDSKPAECYTAGSADGTSFNYCTSCVIIGTKTDMMREQFGLKPKDTGNMYRHPYPSQYKKVILHEQRFAEAKKNFKKINHVYPYMYDSEEYDDSEVAAAEWIQLPAGHVIPSAEELGKRRYCKWHNSGSHSTNDCKVFRQQIQVAIEGGKIKFDDSKKPMMVDGNPFPVNMTHTSGRTADGGKNRNFQMNSARIINKYQRRYEKQQERYYEEENDGGFDPHWNCDFFRFCWNKGMRLPSIEDYPGCSEDTGSSSRSYNRGNRLTQKRVPVHQRLGPVNQDYYHDEDESRKAQWCSTVIFTKNQKRRVQRLRNRERFQEVQQEISHRLRKIKTKQEWRVKSTVTTADEVEADKAKRLLKGKAVFEKPEGTENRHLKPLYINGFVNGKLMSKMMVDGGAAVNLMPYATFKKLGRNSDDLIKTNMCLIQWQGDKIEIMPADSQLKMENPNYCFEGIVEGSNVYTKDTVDDLDDKQGQGFMSANDLEEIDIGPGDRPWPTFISKNLSPEFRTKLIELLKEYRDCFAWEYYEMPGLSRSIVEHRLPIKHGVRPYQQPPRRCKADMLEAVKAEVTRLYDVGFIRPCRYAEWVSNIVPVIKKNGKVRVCIDFWDLNKATPKDKYPMPVADQLVDAASGHKILSFMDGNAGYNQIFMAEEDIHKTAFRCTGAISLFEWVVMPFGLKSIGATYQRAMNYIFHDLIGWLVEVYIDDVVVKPKEIENHIADLRKVFERTRKYGLKMNPIKCAFGVLAGQFLGFLVHEKGIEVTQRSINAIQKIQPPEDKAKLQELISKINFVRRFISNLSGRLEPFIPLLRLKADQKFTWGAEQQKALENIKEYLSSPTSFNSSKKGIPFRLYLSAGDKSIGSVLIQELEGKERVVFYLSRRLLDAETRYYKGCQDCQKFGAIQRAPASAMNPIIKLWPFRGWGMDMIGQINPPFSKGHKFILVATDYFTKWVEAIPLKKVDPGDAIQFVKEHIIYRFGIPQTITTDQGSIFVSDEFVQFADSMGIKLLNSSPYYAQANGQAEVSNKSLIKLIKRKIFDYPRQWHTSSLWNIS